MGLWRWIWSPSSAQAASCPAFPLALRPRSGQGVARHVLATTVMVASTVFFKLIFVFCSLSFVLAPSYAILDRYQKLNKVRRIISLWINRSQSPATTILQRGPVSIKIGQLPGVNNPPARPRLEPGNAWVVGWIPMKGGGRQDSAGRAREEFCDKWSAQDQRKGKSMVKRG